MSAIFGLVNLDGAPVAAADLERMRVALARHGADGGGVWLGDAVGLGQRLTQVTPEDLYERQPLAGPGGQVVVVFDGRIDDRARLAAELGIAGPLSVVPDSALLLAAYERWGHDCVQHVIGEFVCTLWDARERCLVAVRSAVASPSLYFYVSPRTVALATMPKGLFALPFIPRAIDEGYLADYLVLTRLDAGASFYRGLARLRPGQMLVVRPEGPALRWFWQPGQGREIVYPHDEDYVEAFGELFERVVADHLRSLSPVGIMMSGGLDSTSVAATAARILDRAGGRLAAFTEVPRAGFAGLLVPGRYADETPFVQAMARRYANLDLNLIHTDGQTYLEGLDPFFAAAEIPFRNASNRVWYEAILAAAQGLGTRVLLSGGQGNLTISWGGDGLLAGLLAAGKWGQAWHEARALSRQGKARSPAHALLGRGLVPLLPDRLHAAFERRLDGAGCGRGGPSGLAHSPICPAFAAEQRVAERALARGDRYRFSRFADTRQHRGRVILGTTSRGDGLAAGYQALYGVTGRDPTGDVRLVDFCLALPEGQFQRDGQTRWLVRRAMAGQLPPELLANPQRGLQAADWYERLLNARGQILAELARIGQSDLACRALDLPRLRRLVEQMPRAGGDANRLQADYRGVLELGLMTGCFIRWLDGPPDPG